MNLDRLKLGGLLLLMTLLLCPWRNSASQDEAAYAYSAINFADGSTLRHAGTVALNLFQFAAGTAALKIFPSLEQLSVLNFLSWFMFLGSVWFLHAWSRAPWQVVLGYFAFPVIVQFGSCYHGEIYSAFLLVLLIGFLATAKTSSLLNLFLGFFLSFLVGSQLQNMAAFPFFWGAFLFWKGEKSQRTLGISLMAGAVASLALFVYSPKTPFQSGYFYWLAQTWKGKGALLPVLFLISMAQMFSGIGLFLFPMFKYKNRPLKSWLIVGMLQILIFALIKYSGIPVMTAGLMFFEYLPPTITIAILTTGLWGWFGIWPLLKECPERQSNIPVLGTLFAFLAVWVFSTFRYAIDIRYTMTWAIPILFHCRKELGQTKDILGKRLAFMLPLLVGTIFLNLYLLNTTAARWAKAAELEQQGILKNEIAAGYGWNTFFIGSDCMYKVVEKLTREHGEGVWKEQVFFDKFINRYGWAYEDEWIPRFVIKPSKIFGYPLYLRRGRLPGQDSDPIEFVDYSVLGIPNQLAVYENKIGHKAWCFQD